MASDATSPLPSIIWLQTDSMDGRLLDPTSAMYEKVFMREFKSLAASGVNFVRHYTPSPQCVPSRVAMMTGRYPHETGCTNNGQGLARSTKTGKLDSNCVAAWNATQCAAFSDRQNVTATLLDVVAAAGYNMQLFGRFDVGAGILDDYPGTTGDGFHGGPYLGILARGADISGVTKAPPWNTTVTTDPDPYSDDERHVAAAIDYLSTWRPGGDTPLFLWVGLIAPHPPYDSNATWESHVNGSAVDVPPQPSNLSAFDRYSSVSKGCWVNYTEAQIRTMRTAYWGASGEAIDLLVRVVEAARAAGANNTWVIYTSDHGEMALEHRQDYKNSHYEPSLRVPLVAVPLGVPGAAQGVVVTNLTSHVDILPTIAQLCGGTAPPGARGASLAPFLYDGPTPPPRKQYAAAEYHSNLASTGSFSLRAGDYKLIAYGHSWPWFNATAYPPRLFDVSSDVYELNDIAAARPDVVAAMTTTLEAEFGGAGSLATIDAAQMAADLDLYNRFYFQACDGEHLTKAFTGTFQGVPRDDVIAAVTAWAGASPLQANGTGACPQGGGGGAD